MKSESSRTSRDPADRSRIPTIAVWRTLSTCSYKELTYHNTTGRRIDADIVRAITDRRNGDEDERVSENPGPDRFLSALPGGGCSVA
jgi:hypothetical protein